MRLQNGSRCVYKMAAMRLQDNRTAVCNNSDSATVMQPAVNKLASKNLFENLPF